MAFKTYSFEDVILDIQHSSIGIVQSGAGVGSISIAMAGDKTAHDIAGDGGVMITKLPGRNGRVTVQMHQTSALHRDLVKWYNKLLVGNTADWASAGLNISSKHLADKYICTGVSPQKVGDVGYESQGQMVIWLFMCAEITHE